MRRRPCITVLILAFAALLAPVVSTQVNVANNAAEIAGKTLLLAESDQTLTGLHTFDRDPNPPFAVSANSAKVSNLDADLLDGLDATRFSWATVTTTSTGTQNDFSPGITSGQHTLLRLNNASLLTITGFAGGVDGQMLRLVSIGAGIVSLAHQNAGSTTAGDRLINYATSANTNLAAGAGTATLIYDGTSQRWRLVQHEQGDWITPTFAAGDWVSVGGGTVTVQSGDVTRYAYYLNGRRLSVDVVLDTFTYGSPGYGVGIRVPGDYIPVAVLNVITARVGNNTTSTVTSRGETVATAAAGLVIRCDQAEGSATAWTGGTNTNYLRFTTTINVT